MVSAELEIEFPTQVFYSALETFRLTTRSAKLAEACIARLILRAFGEGLFNVWLVKFSDFAHAEVKFGRKVYFVGRKFPCIYILNLIVAQFEMLDNPALVFKRSF